MYRITHNAPVEVLIQLLNLKCRVNRDRRTVFGLPCGRDHARLIARVGRDRPSLLSLILDDSLAILSIFDESARFARSLTSAARCRGGRFTALLFACEVGGSCTIF